MRVAALIGVLVFGLIAISGISAQYQTSVEATQPQTDIINESFTVDNGTVHQLQESNRDVVYNDSVTVTQGGSEYQSDGNYTWYAGNGTLFVPSDTQLANGQANITYHFAEPSSAQQLTKDISMVPFDLGNAIGIIIGAALLLTGIALAGRQ